MLELRKFLGKAGENCPGKAKKFLTEEAKIRAEKQEIVRNVKTLIKSRPKRIAARPWKNSSDHLYCKSTHSSSSKGRGEARKQKLTAYRLN